MRWIDRGPEPDGVQNCARQYTQGWLRYYRDGIGQRPTNSAWRDFRHFLGDRSGNVCWYCERLCQRYIEDIGKAPTVDHFRPLKLCPSLAYEWTNWVYSCRRCNENKRDNWPPSGYVDPSASDEQERPEQYFDYDVLTGEIIPGVGSVIGSPYRGPWRTIDDLGLNKIDVLQRSPELDWTRQFIADWHDLPISYRPALAQSATQLGFEFAGATLMAVQDTRSRPQGL